MTICEALRFSVLSAPVAAADRRSLSQAWYSALYRAGDSKRGIRLQKNAASQEGCELKSLVFRETVAQNAPAARTPVLRAAAALRASTVNERRRAISPLARKIVALAKQASSPRTSATFDLGLPLGRVRVMLRGGPGGMHVVAICASRVRPQVAAALSQARYALATQRILVHTAATADPIC